MLLLYFSILANAGVSVSVWFAAIETFINGELFFFSVLSYWCFVLRTNQGTLSYGLLFRFSICHKLFTVIRVNILFDDQQMFVYVFLFFGKSKISNLLHKSTKTGFELLKTTARFVAFLTLILNLQSILKSVFICSTFQFIYRIF